MDFIYSCKCARCNREVSFRNSSRCLDLAYSAIREFRDPEVVIAHSVELMELANELARGKDFVIVSYDVHIFPEGDCRGRPRVARKINEDFITREAFELISMESDKDEGLLGSA